jgi:hypothetical protein
MESGRGKFLNYKMQDLRGLAHTYPKHNIIRLFFFFFDKQYYNDSRTKQGETSKLKIVLCARARAYYKHSNDGFPGSITRISTQRITL